MFEGKTITWNTRAGVVSNVQIFGAAIAFASGKRGMPDRATVGILFSERGKFPPFFGQAVKVEF